MSPLVRYRGRLADPSRVDLLEDRLLDLALDLGGIARIERDAGMRGVLLDLAPGLGRVSFLVGADGTLLPTSQRPGWIEVETTWCDAEAHARIAEVLDAFRADFAADLEIEDGGGYLPDRDLETLCARHAADRSRAGLPATREDPETLRRLLPEVVETIRAAISGRAVRGGPPDDPRTEDEWDAWVDERERTNERRHRAIEEAMAAGLDAEAALMKVMRDEGLALPEGDFDADPEDDEPWTDSLPELGEFDDAGPSIQPHRLSGDLLELLTSLHALDGSDADDSLRNLLHAVGSAMGAVARALPAEGEEKEPGFDLAFAKRAYRAVAHARALIAPAGPALGRERDRVQAALSRIEDAVFEEVRTSRRRLVRRLREPDAD